MDLKLSIIIPTYNEEENIGRLILYLHTSDPQKTAEIIVSDGQSTDKTVEEATNAGATVIISPEKGRSCQMNYAAAFAKGDVLYFVHSDCLPPPGFVKNINEAVNAGFGLGRYRTKFDSNKILLKLNAWFTRFDWFICYGGDQTLFITRNLFNTINGFKNDMLIMEEYDLVMRARRSSKYKIFKETALVSARKYDTNSWLKVQLANRQMIKMFRKGFSQNEMVAKYNWLLRSR